MSSYKALYRKYRPQTFSEVVDQEYVTQTLKNAISAGKISHAYLFNGPRGIGKTSIARIFAKAINCTNPNGVEPCCECEICKSIVDGSNPDIIEIDAASRTRVEQMRDTLEKVSFLPSTCKYKVYIIDEVHMLSQSSFNALLKTLEEPPSHVIFVLCTTEVEKVIPTIRSRCQRFDFHLISSDTMMERLKYISNEENINIDDDALSLIVDAAEGGMRDALSLLDQISSFSISDTITANDVLQVSGELSTESLIGIASSINVNDSSKAISLLSELIKQGKDIEKITQGLISFFKDILVIKNVGREIKKVGYNRFDFKNVCDSLTNQKIFKYIDVLTQTMSDYRFSTNKRLYLELGIIKMCDQNVGVIPKSTPIQEVDYANTNKTTREPYDPNRVYTGLKQTSEESKPQTQIVEQKEEKQEEVKPQLENIEEIKVEEVKEPVKEEIKEEPVKPVEAEAPKNDAFDLYEMFGDVFEVKDSKKEQEQAPKETYNNVELNFNSTNEQKEEEHIESVEPKTEEIQIELEETRNEEIKEEPVDSFENKEDQDVTIIESFDEEKPEEEEKEETKEEPVQEITSSDEKEESDEDDKEYDIHIIENILNYSDKQFKESVIIKIFNAEKDSRGTDLHKYALLIDDGNIVASSRERFIMTFKEVGHCNLVMKHENYDGVKTLIKKLSGESLDYIAIPEYLWKSLSDQFIIKYKENRLNNIKDFISLSYVPCPGLKNYNKKDVDYEKKAEEDEKMKQLKDIFGDTFKLE